MMHASLAILVQVFHNYDTYPRSSYWYFILYTYAYSQIDYGKVFSAIFQLSYLVG